MRITKSGAAWAAVLAAALLAGPARADNNPNGTVFRAVGWYRGMGSISNGTITCEIPTVTSAIPDGSFVLGIWNTFGVPTFYYPDINSPFGNPCGVWLQLRNNLLDQGITLDHVELRYRIAGARRFRSFVRTRNGFPIACRSLRHQTVFSGLRMDAANSTATSSGSGAPNVVFAQMLPFVTPQQINCLRSQYAPLPTSVFTSLQLVVRATAVGVSDAGDTFSANVAPYTLTLRHSCGNGRVDDGEECDPTAPINTSSRRRLAPTISSANGRIGSESCPARLRRNGG